MTALCGWKENRPKEPMQTQNNKLIRKIFLSYAFTFMVINFADSLTMIADGMMVSRGLNAAALAATGLADPSYKIATLFAGILAAGLQSMCAQAMGSGDKKRVNEIFSAGLRAALAVSLLITVLGFSCTDSLCRLFGAGERPELYDHLYAYLRGWFTGLPGYVLFFVLSPLVSLDGNKKLVTAATFLQSIINIGGDALSVFVFRTGTYGVGFSTGLSYNLSAALLLLNFVRKQSVFSLRSASPDYRVLQKTLRIGLPKITEQICRILAPILINRTVMAVGGSSAMSALSVKASIMGFCVIIGNGIAESLGLMTQILYSEKDAVSLKQTVKVGLEVHLTLTGLMTLLLFAAAGGISRLYFAPGTTEWTLARQAVRCLALALLTNGCNQILVRYLQGTRKMVQVHTLTLFQRFIALTLFTALLGYKFGTPGLFAAIPVSEAAVLLGYLAAVLLLRRRGSFWDSVLMLDGGFGYNEENSFSVSISTLEEAVAVSERIEAFCLAHGVDPKKSFFSARCMEELSVNVIERGFTRSSEKRRNLILDNQKHHCDIRVMIDPEEVVLRIRDDCPYFNLRERYDSLAEDDIDAGVWIRLVYALAKEVSYINIFNTNTLIIRM